MNLSGLKFSKMHGLGNDYVVINEFDHEIIPENEKNTFSIEICKRGFSVGADGVIFVCPATDNGDIKFRIFNADGSEAEMCGNGIRCFSKYVYDNDIIKKDKLNVETLGGLKIVEITPDKENKNISSLFKVDMGISTFKTAEIPMIAETEEFLDETLVVDGEEISMTTISVGNPHAVIFTENAEKIDLNNYGPAIENHESFPQRINVHFVEIISKNEIKMITWERGAGFTYACGTGATSCVLSGFKLGILDNNVLVHLPGGDLEIEVYKKDDELGAFMKGEAELVFTGKMI
ncbi:diaminopimelate epimerase [Methanobrevibacter sp. TMH8]|uniref:diaminopimelate epimerase n=1 Tax=Methanobrevibacter sp. TMH8 TaxID=2848611 RepID=UPI001CCEF89C|nr:diaminopimelate epimerase [Methanobrevibacter sp. TMH8]MBZ9570059.1 diaminopimelate epimerase [Methanobrevibacter sp. TMH8]